MPRRPLQVCAVAGGSTVPRVPRGHAPARRLAVVLTVAAAGLAGTAGASVATAAPRTEDARPPIPLTRVVGGIPDALYVTGAPGESSRLYVVRQSGTVRIVRRGRLLAQPFLDLRGITRSGGEQGLLGLAFHPDYAENRRLFVNYTDLAGDTWISEYRADSLNRVDTATARPLLRIEQPYSNHNGGHLAFGPDGLLYIATGDGGDAGDPQGNGQDTGSLLGKILRIDVDRRDDGRAYAIPEGNPFSSGGGRPEIFAYGLRNPWRFSFDRATGDLWIADVGQGRIEEVNRLAAGTGAGANLGWNAYEGRSPFAGPGAVEGRAVTWPVAQYSHSRGCSVTGGYVSRGRRAATLRGRYVFADYCTGELWSMRAGPRPGGLRRETARLTTTLRNVTSFGEGTGGDLYVISGGGVWRFTG